MKSKILKAPRIPYDPNLGFAKQIMKALNENPRDSLIIIQTGDKFKFNWTKPKRNYEVGKVKYDAKKGIIEASNTVTKKWNAENLKLKVVEEDLKTFLEKDQEEIYPSGLPPAKDAE